MLVENNVRRGFLTVEEYSRLRNELPDYLRPLFVIGFHVGCRRGELLNLRWSQVDLAARQIVLDPGTTKNGEGRTLPIYGEMSPILEMQRAVRDASYPNCDFVFQIDGRRIGDFRKAWATACKRVGLAGLHFHDLRRSAVRNMVNAGIAEKTAMHISGHKTRSVFDRYNIVSARDIQTAGKRLEKLFEESLGTNSGTVAENQPINKPSQIERKDLM
jgi:integrase